MRTVRRLGRSVRTWRHAERGMSEVAAAIVVIPLMIALIFTLLEVGINLHFRSRVDAIVADTLRGVSHDGANYDVRTYTGPRAYGSADQGWQAWGQDQLRALCGDSRCGTRPRPTLSCTPVDLQQYAGEEAQCTARFTYKPITGGLLNNPVMNLGFGGLWGDEIQISMRTVTTVGSGY